MSILIKGMEMPKNCWACACYHHKVDDGYYDYDVCQASGTVFNDGYASVTGHKDHIDPFKQRLDNCPLVPVPPHGRLIDADALDADLERQDMKTGEWDAVGFSISEIDNAPTIIPASGGKENE